MRRGGLRPRVSFFDSLYHAVFQPGFFSNPAVRSAAAIGAVVAVVCAPAGVFAVMRGQSFAGHAFSDIATTGGSAAVLLGISPLFGFVAMGVAGGGAMELLSREGRDAERTSGGRQAGRDLSTGVVLGAGLGLSALLLYFTATLRANTGTTVTVLFGSVFSVGTSALVPVSAFGGAVLAVLVATHRRLLLASVSPELASLSGNRPSRFSPAVRERAVGLAYMMALALSVALSALAIGAILSTALLVGPAATSFRLAKSPGRAVLWAALIGTGSTLLGILLAYDSYSWPPAGHGWPVSFFVVSLVVAAYLLSRPASRLVRRFFSRKGAGG
jgi:zinc/manganese transport system permease protein